MSTQAKSVYACGALAFSLLSMCLLQPSISPAAKSLDQEGLTGVVIETMESEGTEGTVQTEQTTDGEEETFIEDVTDAALAESEEVTVMTPEPSEESFSAGMATVLNEGEKARTDAEMISKLETGEEYFSAGMATAMNEGAQARAAIIRVVPNVDGAMNIRAEASEEAAVVGKFYRGCVGEQVETADGWIKVQSGAVTGWVSAEYVRTGAEADQMIAELNPVVVTVNTDTLNVRKEAGTEAAVLAVASAGQTFMAGEVGDEWVRIFYTPDITGYVATEFVTVENKAGTAVDIETVKALQAEADKKEAERKAQEKKQQIAVTTGSPMLASVDDATLLAALCQYEAGSNYDGCLAVANVVLNRVRSGGYPNSIAEVIYAPGQFGSVRSGALNRYLNGGISGSARQAANDALAGVNNIGGYLHFCSGRVANVNSFSSYAVIGGNYFYTR
ncbi:MAG: cell wall hydrolase [Lachnospiraceae bacterium]|nr:cell wall hydrolase [Lachnospiraceae bacterium]